MNAKGLTIAAYLTLTSCAMTSGPLSEPAPLLPEGDQAAVPLSDAKDLVSEVVRDKDRLMVIQRPKQLLSRSDAACVPGRTMRVKWMSMYICRTPDDFGSKEEWRIRYYAGRTGVTGELGWKANISPPDQLNYSTENYSRCWRYVDNRTKYLQIPADSASAGIMHQMQGYEEDEWGDHDKLPAPYGVQGMFTNMDNCEGNFFVMTNCGYSPDEKRYSCIETEFRVKCQRNCWNKHAGAPDGCGGTCRECEEPSPACLPCNTCSGKCCGEIPSCFGVGTRCDKCVPSGSPCP
jgi:hypothetical protein